MECMGDLEKKGEEMLSRKQSRKERQEPPMTKELAKEAKEGSTLMEQAIVRCKACKILLMQPSSKVDLAHLVVFPVQFTQEH